MKKKKKGEQDVGVPWMWKALTCSKAIGGVWREEVEP
jgi:hypothetical protein